MLRIVLEKKQRVESDKEAILDYLRRGKEVAAAPGFVRDKVTKERTPITLFAYSDGVFEWTSSEIYHVENYNYQLPDLFLEYIRKNVH